MSKRPVRWLLSAAVLFTACTDHTLPTEVIEPPPVALDVTTPPEEGVGTFGQIETIKPQEQGLVLYQTGFDALAEPGSELRNARHELSVGAKHQKLQVQIKDETEIWVGGVEASVADLEEGMEVLVVGRVTGAALHAERITDMSDAGPPPDDVAATLAQPGAGAAPFIAAGIPEVAGVTSMCMGQRLPFDPDEDPDVGQFQGCWGGPSASDYLNTGFIPLICPLIGCVGFDRLTYTMALGGWGFAFPMRFEAGTASNLVYHVPGEVSFGVTPESADPAASFWGGLGLDFGIRFKFCSIFGCYNLGTLYLSAFSTIHRSNDPAPLTGEVLDIQTTSCPSIAIIPIEDFPLNPLALGLCQDLELEGAAFGTRVTVSGAAPSWSSWQEFGPDPVVRTVRPGSMSVGIRYDLFDWRPQLNQGLAFRFKIFSIPVYTTPAIPLGGGRWDPITTPYPESGSVFTLATDPESPVNDLRYLYHPTQVGLDLEVDPAPTTLTLASGGFVPEGNPITARLQEEWDGSPIVGHPVTLQVTGLGGSASSVHTASTDATGAAHFMIPPGEYALRAIYGGAETYLPSSDTEEPVYVYTPTTFVIWGGNPGGIDPGALTQFWGRGWVRQVVGGDFGGNASFQGFGVLGGRGVWSSPPASSGPMPISMSDVISVIVTTRVTGRGSLSMGDVAGYAILRVHDPGSYRPAGGHVMWGTLRAFLP